MMPKCIYCDKRESDSEEHSFPAALGMDRIKGFVKLEKKLCRECNSRIGAIEEQFLRCSPEAFFRYRLKIEGRKTHDEINPYHRPSAGGRPIKAEINDPEISERYLCEPDEESDDDFTYSCQIVLKDLHGKLHRVIVPDNVNSSEALDKLLASKGMSDFEVDSAIIDIDRKHVIEGISNPKVKSCNWADIPAGHRGTKEFLLTFEYTDRYFRAIAKIAFHYFLQYFEHYDGHEKEFEGIKNFIMHGGDVKEWVTLVPGSFIENFKSKSSYPNVCGHFIVAEDTGDRIFVKAGFFYGRSNLQDRHFEVKIGKSPGLIKTPKSSAHQILYFDEKDDEGYIGEMKELRRYDKRFLSSLLIPKREYMRLFLRAIRRDFS